MATNPVLQIRIPPLRDTDVEYYETITIPISITDVSSGPVLVESIALELQTDAGIVNRPIEKSCGHRIEPGNTHDEHLNFSPTPEFKESTCTFKVLIRFREMTNGALKNQDIEIRDANDWILIRPSSNRLGQLFISFKQPQNTELADLLGKMAIRAGFTVYMAKDDPQPGVDIWQKIEPALRASVAILVLWTHDTQWGVGVEREITLCRSLGIPDVLIIQEGEELPEAYLGSAKEYQRFNPVSPAAAFSQVITTRRNVALSRLI